ncbi:MAG: hypothetical protein WD226_00430 [Planctomycetota bacterium]
MSALTWAACVLAAHGTHASAQSRIGEVLPFEHPIPLNAAERRVLGVLDPGPSARIVYGAAGHGAGPALENAGHVAVVARTGRVLFERTGERPFLHLGHFAASIGDVTGDGRDDFVVSTRYRTSIIDGATFEESRVLAEQASKCANLGDLDGDGRDDLLDWSTGLVLGGAPGAPVNAPEYPLASVNYRRPAWFVEGSRRFDVGARALARPFVDRDGDGVRDYLVAWSQPAVDAWGERDYDCLIGLHSAATGEFLAGAEGPLPWSWFGRSFDVLGDVSGDGVPELIVSTLALPYAEGVRTSDLYRVDGASLEITERATRLRGEFRASNGEVLAVGESIRAVGDVNRNGSPDFLTTILLSQPHPAHERFGLEKVVLIDGSTLEPIWEFVDLDLGAAFSNVIEPAGDVDEDGFPDFVAASLTGCAFYSTRPAGAQALGGAVALCDGRVPAIGVDAPIRLARGRLVVNLTDVPADRPAYLLVSHRAPTVGAARLLVPDRILPATTRSTGPFVHATLELPLSSDPACLGRPGYIQWIVPERRPDATIHLGASQVLELTPLP